MGASTGIPITITPSTGAVLTVAAGKTLTASNTLTLAGTDSTTMTFPATSATIARTDAGQTFTGNQTITGNITVNGTLVSLNGNSAVGNGVGILVANNRIVAQTNNATIGTYTVPASDTTYQVSANLLVTAATAVSTSLNIAYTDESNTSRTMILPATGLAGTFLSGGLAVSTGPAESAVIHIRCKASTTITATVAAGTFTGVTYNAEWRLTQV